MLRALFLKEIWTVVVVACAGVAATKGLIEFREPVGLCVLAMEGIVHGPG